MTSAAPFPFARLSRLPDLEAPGLVAADAADRTDQRDRHHGHRHR